MLAMALVSRARVRGVLRPPGDKSISHRAALIASLALGRSVLHHVAPGEDCRRTLDVLEHLGIEVTRKGDSVEIEGRGYFGLRAPAGDLDAGNSGTTIRLACGLLAGQDFDSRITGDESLRRRPMRRVIVPLEKMGASFSSDDGRAPIMIHGGRVLRGIEYTLPVPSAQVKSAVLLAGLHAEGKTRVEEPLPSRNHTELLLRRMGASIELGANVITIEPQSALRGTELRIPGDVSSAAFFIAAASFLPGSELVVENVGLNPTRTAFLGVLKNMGARVAVEELAADDDVEPVGTVRVQGTSLSGTEIPAEWVPSLIDEIPALMVAALFAEGVTSLRGAEELRVKESDRLNALAEGLAALGATVEVFADGIRVGGGTRARGARLQSFGDHRMAMAWAIASLGIDEPCEIQGREIVDVSFPTFWRELERLVA